LFNNKTEKKTRRFGDGAAIMGNKWIEEELEPGLRVNYRLAKLLNTKQSKWQTVDLVRARPPWLRGRQGLRAFGRCASTLAVVVVCGGVT
jgi:hypothetical protein